MSASELEILAEELQLRQNFECETRGLLELLIHRPPEKVTDVAEAWVGVLRQQRATRHAAAIAMDERKEGLIFLACTF